jgi:hypothetical protein
MNSTDSRWTMMQRIRRTNDEPDPDVAESPLDPVLEGQPSSGWNLFQDPRVLMA